MVKKASAEQVKELAGMIKSAKLQKKALQYAPVIYGVNTGKGPARILNAIFKNFGTVNRGSTLPPAAAPFLKQLGKGTLKYGLPAAGLFGGGIALGNIGKSSLREDLTKANESINKLTEQKKALENQSGWAKLWEDFKKWWAKLWESKQEAPKVANK